MKSLATLIRNGDAHVARVWSIVSASLLLATAGWSQRLIWLGTLPGGSWSSARDVSADGSVVVGSAQNAAGLERAFRWVLTNPATGAGTMYDLGTVGGSRSRANGVSADGSVVVGTSEDAGGEYRAFRWQNGVMRNLGTLPRGSYHYSYSEANGVSADGSVVVGLSFSPNGDRAFRWTQQTGMQNLGTLPGGHWSEAYGVSEDGSIVVGCADNSGWYWRVFRWTQQTGMQDLGSLGIDTICARAVSADGSVVVGEYRLPNGGPYRAFRWTQQGFQDLGTLVNSNDSDSVALDVSADGSVVVGRAENAAGYAAFRWTPQTGMQDLNQVYASLLTNRSQLLVANAISPNGRYIVGQGYNAATRRYEAFLLDTGQEVPPGPSDGDVNGDGCVDDADLLTVLFNFGRGCQ